MHLRASSSSASHEPRGLLPGFIARSALTAGRDPSVVTSAIIAENERGGALLRRTEHVTVPKSADLRQVLAMFRVLESTRQ